MNSFHADQSPRPRFNVSDLVIVIGPGPHRNKHGIVMEVLPHSGDCVYRYRVQFSNSQSATFFGFELTFKQAWSAAS